MDYTQLTIEQRVQLLTQTIAELESRHFNLTCDLEVARALGTDEEVTKVEGTLGDLEDAIAIHTTKLDAIRQLLDAVAEEAA